MFELLANMIGKAIALVLTEMVVMGLCYIIITTVGNPAYCDIMVVVLMIMGIISGFMILKGGD